MSVAELLKRSALEHLSQEEYLCLVERAPLEALKGTADRIRRKMHSDETVSYIIDRNINYSNICSAVCTFCAFYRKPGSTEGYVLTYEDIFEKVEETLSLGGSGILMQVGIEFTFTASLLLKYLLLPKSLD